ncbi:MAG: LAGLIDADG family homing endonuclease [Thermodesulfobacteriota bacterium]
MSTSSNIEWSKHYERCLVCGTQETPHHAKGYCKDCYKNERGWKYEYWLSRKPRKSNKRIDVREIQHLYQVRGISLAEIAIKYNCTKQYIYKILKRYGIKRRDKISASTLAFERGKYVRSVIDESGIKKDIVLEKTKIDKTFFKKWSAEMAYVLGVLYSDGNLQLGRPQRGSNIPNIPPAFSLAQKHSELLKKVLSLMKCTAKMHFSENRKGAGEIYIFKVVNREVCSDLLRLGLKPRKSLIVTFPAIPFEYTRHFIRGCWDGDGTVYLENNQLNKAKASLTSGSRDFIQSLIANLELLGLPKRTIYTNKNGKSFYFRYHGKACAKLYHIFYDGVSENMYLTRKFKMFEKVAGYYEKQQELAGS